VDKLNRNLPELKLLSKQLADLGAMVKFLRSDDLFVVTITMGHEIRQTECKTSTELVEKLKIILRKTSRDRIKLRS
jgi:hypothetical protein